MLMKLTPAQLLQLDKSTTLIAKKKTDGGLAWICRPQQQTVCTRETAFYVVLKQKQKSGGGGEKKFNSLFFQNFLFCETLVNKV